MKGEGLALNHALKISVAIIPSIPIAIDLLPGSLAGEINHRPKRKLPHDDTIRARILTSSIPQAIDSSFARLRPQLVGGDLKILILERKRVQIHGPVARARLKLILLCRREAPAANVRAVRVEAGLAVGLHHPEGQVGRDGVGVVAEHCLPFVPVGGDLVRNRLAIIYVIPTLCLARRYPIGV